MSRVLRGAFVLAALSGVSLGCVSANYSREREQDRALSARVNEALQTALPGRTVEGRAYHGVVALLGEVATDQGRRSAEAAARAVPGVARVNNLILVEEGNPSRTVGSAPVQGTPVIAARANQAPAP